MSQQAHTYTDDLSTAFCVLSIIPLPVGQVEQQAAVASAMRLTKTTPLRCTSAADGVGEAWLAAFVVLTLFTGRAAF